MPGPVLFVTVGLVVLVLICVLLLALLDPDSILFGPRWFRRTPNSGGGKQRLEP